MTGDPLNPTAPLARGPSGQREQDQISTPRVHRNRLRHPPPEFDLGTAGVAPALEPAMGGWAVEYNRDSGVAGAGWTWGMDGTYTLLVSSF